MTRLSQKLKTHFDEANSRYIQIDNINEVIASKFNDFDLRNHINQKVNRILNIGIGNGLELIALYKIYKKEKTEIIGVDVSSASIKLAKDLLIKNKIDPRRVEMVNCSAINLSFPDEYVDIVFMNSLLHEVFSYSPNGENAWELAIKEACRVLTAGGILYIEDFAGVNETGKVDIVFKTNFARKFYEYFRNEYRLFRTWGKTHQGLFSKERKRIIENLPVLDETKNSVLLGSALALELLTHFKIFNNDFNKGLTVLGDTEWIEINERYYLSAGGVRGPLGTSDYIERVLDIANRDIRFQIEALESHEIERKNFLEDIKKHFSAHNETGNDFIQFSSKKMKIMFRKVA